MKLQNRLVALYRRASGLSKTGIHRDLPDVNLTPGSVLTISERKVLAPGWSNLARDVTDKQKKEVFAAYGLDYGDRHRFLVDHLVPCCLGGANSLDNLWPHSHSAAHPPGLKYRLEQRLLRAVRRKLMPLAEAQAWLCLNWIEAYEIYVKGTVEEGG